jgi:hypothetical protein
LAHGTSSSKTSTPGDLQGESATSTDVSTEITAPIAPVPTTSSSTSSTVLPQVAVGVTSSSSKIQLPPGETTTSPEGTELASTVVVVAYEATSTDQVLQATKATSTPTLNALGIPESSTAEVAVLAATQEETSPVNTATVGANTVSGAAATVAPLPPVSTSNVIIQIVVAIGHRKRGSSNTYLVPGSADGSQICDPTQSFTLSNGELTTSDGQYLSTSNGVTWMTFQTSTTILSISTDFTLDANGYVVWQNNAFVGDRALFCEQANGQIDVLFQGQTDVSDPSYPLYGSTCTPVNLQVMDSKCTCCFP